MTPKIVVVIIIGVTALGVFDLVVRAQSPSSARAGVYTEAQAKRGQALYDKSCAECHGASLNGAEGPPLTGTEFMSRWTGETIGELFDKLQLSMPAGSPGSVSRQEKADILAYMLSVNNFPSGPTELAGETELLKQIPFDATKP